jgi:glycosyltransferase involved in cell wall biosynthesis
MVVHSHYPVREPRAEREARAAVEAGYAVTVICLRWPDEPAAEVIDEIRVRRLPVRHVRGGGTVRAVTEYVGFALQAVVAVLRIHRQSPIDVVYVHAPPDFLIITALLPRLRGSRVILDIHDLSPDMFDARFGGTAVGRLIGPILRRVERIACSVAEQVITVHVPYLEELIAHGVPPEKISVVMNAPAGEELELVSKEPASPPEAVPFLVAYHGTVTHWYGVDLLVEAIARLEDRIPQIRGLVLGEGDAFHAAEVLAQEAGVADRIEFSNTFVSHLDALRLVGGANCGVVPNRPTRLNRFALSSKLLEYVALGIPAVVARLETLEAHFASEEVTFFEPGNPESLAQAIAWVAEHPVEAREKALRAQRRAEAYSWSASRRRFLDALADGVAAT